MSIRCIALAIALTLGVTSAQARDLVLGISEGTSGGTDHARVVQKYGGLAEAIGKAIKADVKVVFVREFAQLEDGMKSSRLDLVLARPSDYPARGLRDYGYRYVASVKPEGQCLIVVPKDSPIRQLADLKGKKIVMPEKIAYMTKFCRAELRRDPRARTGSGGVLYQQRLRPGGRSGVLLGGGAQMAEGRRHGAAPQRAAAVFAADCVQNAHRSRLGCRAEGGARTVCKRRG